MHTDPLVSVIIPSYNYGNYIGQTIRSVANQTYSELEILIIDDASTDDTEAAVSRINDERVHFLKIDHTGVPSSVRNAGLKISRGEYVAFIDSDDLWVEDKIQKQLTRMREVGAMWCYSDFEAFQSETGKKLYNLSDNAPLHEGDISSKLLIRNFVGSPTPIVHRSILDRVGLFDSDWSIRFREDWEFWLRVASHYPIGVVREPLARYRVHARSNSVTAHPDNLHLAERTVIYKALGHNPEKYGPIGHRALRGVFADHAYHLLRSNQRERAIELLQQCGEGLFSDSHLASALRRLQWHLPVERHLRRLFDPMEPGSTLWN